MDTEELPVTPQPEEVLPRPAKLIYVVACLVELGLGVNAGFAFDHWGEALSAVSRLTPFVAAGVVVAHVLLCIGRVRSKLLLGARALVFGVWFGIALVAGGWIVACATIETRIELAERVGDRILERARTFHDREKRWPTTYEELGVEPRELRVGVFQVEYCNWPYTGSVPWVEFELRGRPWFTFLRMRNPSKARRLVDAKGWHEYVPGD